jgi:hypothetical protein
MSPFFVWKCLENASKWMVFIIFYNGKSYEHPYEHVMKNPMNMG